MSGNVADDDGQLIASSITDFGDISGNARHIIRPFLGSFEFINGRQRYCLWVEDADLDVARSEPEFVARFERVNARRSSVGAVPIDKEAVNVPHKDGFLTQR